MVKIFPIKNLDFLTNRINTLKYLRLMTLHGCKDIGTKKSDVDGIFVYILLHLQSIRKKT